MFSSKRLIIFTGNYGSGKTELAINYAIEQSQRDKVALIDIDIVKPFFRAREAENILQKHNITLVKPMGALATADLPALSPQIQGVMTNNEYKTIVDVGGDPVGAVALGRYSKSIEGLYSMYLVVNICRPYTSNVDQIISMKNDLEGASRLKFCGIINNTNLGIETDWDIVNKGEGIVKEAGNALGLPFVCTVVNKRLLVGVTSHKGVYPIDIFIKPPWQIWREVK